VKFLCFESHDRGAGGGGGGGGGAGIDEGAYL